MTMLKLSGRWVVVKLTPSDWKPVLKRAEGLLQRLEQWLPPTTNAPDWQQATAFRWRHKQQVGYFQPITHPHKIELRDLQNIDTQKYKLEINTLQFVNELPANNALLWGAKGTGKSSLIKALLNAYAKQGLRLLEVDKEDLVDLPDIVESCRGAPFRFLVFSDDLSFEANDPSYKVLKSVLDGSVAAPPDNVLIYVTSNRRHLLPEFMSDNQDAKHVGDELHQHEGVEERISLSERFGLWLSFYPFNQADYLQAVDHWLVSLGWSSTKEDKATRQAALQWALLRGSRSGRAAWQFAQDWAGQRRLEIKNMK